MTFFIFSYNFGQKPIFNNQNQGGSWSCLCEGLDEFEYQTGLCKCHYTYVRENLRVVLSTFTYKLFENRVVLSVRSTLSNKFKVRSRTSVLRNLFFSG